MFSAGLGELFPKILAQQLEGISMKVRSVLVVILSVGIFWGGVPEVFAHTIDVVAAREKARGYARQKVADPNRAYEHYTTDCLAAFSGHNHYVRCAIFYLDENRVQLCKERIEVYLDAHRRGKGLSETWTWIEDPTMFVKHTSAKEC